MHVRPESSTTDGTGAFTETAYAPSTPRTSIHEEDEEEAHAAVCKDDNIGPDADIPEIPTPKAVPQPMPIIEERTSEPAIERVRPAIEKSEKIEEKVISPEPIMTEKVAPTKPAVQTQPAVARPPPQQKKKKGLLQKIKAALCCGSSDQMES
ncbi:hypothetical protein FRC07_007424 [Ceratobasidium sp. 392]|nr:hypothetical protein FRC07_007424 [Ceratobasidium sp. 392]